jgi:molecular chaperone GrpE (heat shock protein)
MVIHIDDRKRDKTVEEEKKDSQVEKVTQGDEEPTEKKQKAEEKPLEKMTKAELLEKIKGLQEESKKNYDLYLRSQAEMENIKKRNAKEKEEWIKYSNETLIKEILPVLDNLERQFRKRHIPYSERKFTSSAEGRRGIDPERIEGLSREVGAG